MFSIIIIILCFNIIYINSQTFKDICFSIIGDPEKNVLIKFNDLLSFVPNVIEIRAVTKGYTSVSFVSVLKRNSYFLRKELYTCSNSLTYDVPYSHLPILTVNFTISFGDPGIVLDKLQAAMKPNFNESEHILDGLLRHTQVKVILRHESYNQGESVERSVSKPPYRWSSKLRRLRSGESFCLSLFTTEFSEPLVFFKYPTKGFQPLTYYIFTVSTAAYMIPYQLQMKKYLSRVYPCSSSIPSEKKLKIYVSPLTTHISFELIEKNYEYSYKIQYAKRKDRFMILTRYPSFDFYKLSIENMYLSQDMVDNKSGMLLYHNELGRKYCDVDSPSFLKNLRLSYIDISKARSVILRRHSRFIDESTSNFRIYKIRVATPSEIEKCLR